MNTFFNIIEKEKNEEGIVGNHRLTKLYGFLKAGTYLVTFQRLDPKSDEKAYRGLYFFKVQAIAEEIGHSKKEMHEIVKEHLITKLFNKDSTKDLTLEEWLGLVKAIDLWAYQTYEIFLG